MPEQTSSIEERVDGFNRAAVRHYEQGHYDQGLRVAQKARALARRVLGEHDPRFAICLKNLALFSEARGDYAEAEAFLQQALAIQETAFGKRHPEVASSLNNLAKVSYEMERYSAARKLFQKALTMQRALLGKQHPEVAIMLSNLAACDIELGNLAHAEPLLKQALAIQRAALGEHDPAYAVTLSNLAGLVFSRGNYQEASQYFQRVLDMQQKALGPDHPSVADGLNNLAMVYRDMGNYVEAEPLARQALAMYRSILGKQHPALLPSILLLAAISSALKNFQAAEPLWREALDMQRASLGERHPHIAATLTNLADVYNDLGDYDQAEQLYQQALSLIRSTPGEHHPTLATTLNNLATILIKTGRYTQARALLEEVLALEAATVGKRNQTYTTALSNLAALLRDMGYYAQSRTLLEEAVDIEHATLGNQHPWLASSLNSLAILHKSQGNYSLARSLYEEALEIERVAFGENYPGRALLLNNLAKLYYELNDAQAETLYQQALAIQRAVLGEQHCDYAITLNNLAGLYKAMGRYAEAEPLYVQALATLRERFGEQHPQVAVVVNNLAGLYDGSGEYAQAEPMYAQALAIQQATLGEQHPDVANTLQNLAGVKLATGQKAEAFALMQQVMEIDHHLLGQVFSTSSEYQRMAYLATLEVHFHLFLSLVVDHLRDSTEAVLAAARLVLQRKGIGAEALTVQREALFSNRYPALAPKLHALTLLRAQIAQKTLEGPRADAPEVHRHLLATWKQQREQVEAELASQIPEMNLTRRLAAVHFDEVLKLLPEGAALIEYVQFRPFDFYAVPARNKPIWKPTRYLAFVFAAGQPDAIQLLDLGEASFIDHTIAEFRAAITGEAESAPLPGARAATPGQDQAGLHPSEKLEEVRYARIDRLPPATNSDYLARGDLLRSSVFDPALAALGHGTRLLLAPDGNLTRLPFAVLPLKDGRAVLDAYHLSYLGAGRDLLRLEDGQLARAGLPFVLADPAFDLGSPAGQLAAEMYEPSGRRSLGIDVEGFRFRRLPGTRAEGEYIAALLGVSPLLGEAALERALKACQSPSIVHIATHGFFLPDQRPALPEDGLGENILLRSGLALAGANTWCQGGVPPPEAEDGLLTAEDVAALDLSSTALVVLSACETGLGHVQAGEGVYGLQRAFMLAGAKTLVMSLWKVPDDVTRQLMAQFYQRLLAGQPRAEALRLAQLDVKAHSASAHPFYWGAFICQGDPTPLAGRSSQ